uniref:Defensin-like cystein-rich peptide n=1 Tax=Torenia fournieri TaxID=68875 RepID=B9ZZY1_9LAMI|nr:defensin-like cystein-rich peptide [Torenia fournieri]
MNYSKIVAIFLVLVLVPLASAGEIPPEQLRYVEFCDLWSADFSGSCGDLCKKKWGPNFVGDCDWYASTLWTSGDCVCSEKKKK